MPVHESDVCIIGGGITSAMLAQKLSELRPEASITVVEAGRSIFDTQNRGRYRQRALEYGEHPWHDDFIEDQQAKGIISMTMAVGGLALHWGGACNRFSEEDTRLKSLYGLAVDWPVEWKELERYYCEAERRLHVSGEPSPYPGDWRSEPYPQRPTPLSYNLQVLKAWAERSGLKFSPLPMARNLDRPFDGRGFCCVFDTCGQICPSGARYSPDFTWRQLTEAPAAAASERSESSRNRAGVGPREDREMPAAAASERSESSRNRAGVGPREDREMPAAAASERSESSRPKVVLHDRTLVRRLVLDDRSPRVVSARGVHQDRPDDPVDYRARLFVVASGYTWSSHLLLLSATSRFPNGLANSSGLVGRYMNGHKFIEAIVTIDDQLFPGQNMVHSLISREYFRSPADRPFVRHDTRVWESSAGRDPRLRGPGGKLLLGDELVEDWRSRTGGGSVRLRTYIDVHPSIDSRLALDSTSRNRYGDPMPKIEHRLDGATLAREPATKQHVLDLFNRLARASSGKIVATSEGDYLDHPGGGCRMGVDPSASVVDSFGRTHDHENLFVVGAPTTPTGGCTNGTLTFVALTLRSADEIAKSLRA